MGEVESHPEDYCDRCGGPNIWSWFVPSDRFNMAMEALGLNSGAIVCPVCFVDGHELSTGMRSTWQLVPEDPFHHIGAIEGERPAGVRAALRDTETGAAMSDEHWHVWMVQPWGWKCRLCGVIR